MIQQNKVLGTLGLAMRSGNIACGEFLTEEAIRSGKARLVIVEEVIGTYGKNENI